MPLQKNDVDDGFVSWYLRIKSYSMFFCLFMCPDQDNRDLTFVYLHVQSSVVITRSNIAMYFIQHFNYWDIIYRHTQIHPIARPLWVVFCEDFWENWWRYNGIALDSGTQIGNVTMPIRPWPVDSHGTFTSPLHGQAKRLWKYDEQLHPRENHNRPPFYSHGLTLNP